jgi:uncharacterized protein
MNNNGIDWKTLQFECRNEDKLAAAPDSEAQANYEKANSLHKSGIKAGNELMLAESVKLLHTAAEKGHVKAMNNLVLAYLDGEGVKQSDKTAVEWAEKMIARNSGRGHYHMGVFLEQGIGVKPDRAAALTYMRKAADLGNPQGQLAAAKSLIRTVAQTPERDAGYAIATSMLKCALAQGLAEAGYELGVFYKIHLEDMPQALAAYQAGAKLGHNQSLFKLATLFEDGRDGLPKDDARAACYRRLLSELDADKSKTFPNLDQICPLPPRKMPGA